MLSAHRSRIAQLHQRHDDVQLLPGCGGCGCGGGDGGGTVVLVVVGMDTEAHLPAQLSAKTEKLAQVSLPAQVPLHVNHQHRRHLKFSAGPRLLRLHAA